MNVLRKNLLIFAMVSSCAAVTANAQENASIAEALKAGTTKLHLRPRYEHVEFDGFEDATGLTLKTRLTYTSGAYNGFGLTLEMDDTTAFFEDDYMDPGTAPLPDPEVTEVNQSYISYTNGGVTGKYGRQRILLDNQRFVGGVGWRQDEQTYDGLSVNFKPSEELNLFGAYVTQVNRIFGETQDHNVEAALLNASYNFGFMKLIGYGYLIDNKTALALASDTFGVRAEIKLNEIIGMNVEFATQSEAGDNPAEYTANYQMIGLDAAIPVSDKKVNLGIGYEVLGSDDGVSFKTPLATLHAFQGWTDRFLVTPPDGIEDFFVSAGTKFGTINAMVVYHTFSSDEGSIDYGDEIGFVLGTKVNDVGLTLKYADFSGDDGLGDTSKLWLMAAMTF